MVARGVPLGGEVAQVPADRRDDRVLERVGTDVLRDEPGIGPTVLVPDAQGEVAAHRTLEREVVEVARGRRVHHEGAVDVPQDRGGDGVVLHASIMTDNGLHAECSPDRRSGTR
ncbi:hypothetical protein [Curtobacterium sp. 24E2]|nr:hypothetical protein JN350_11020 [Curtobacterium sp. 24E2]